MDVNIIGGPATNLVQFSPGAVTAPPQTSIATPALTPAPVPAAGIVTSDPTVAHAPAAPSTPSAPPTLKQVQQAVDNINASLSESGQGQSVQFAIDPTSKHIVVQVRDPQSGKVIRQIPSEEIIQMGMSLGQKTGQVIKEQA